MDVVHDPVAIETIPQVRTVILRLPTIPRAALAGVLLAAFPASMAENARPANEIPVAAVAPEAFFPRLMDASDATDLDELQNASLIDVTIRIHGDAENEPDVIVRIHGGPNGLELHVDGKTYDIENNMLLPGITLAKVIDEADLSGETITLASKEYGTAVVTLSEAKEFFRELSRSENPTVTRSFDATFTPKEGSLLEKTIAMAKEADRARRNLEAWMKNAPVEPEPAPNYQLTVKRRDPQTYAAR